MFGKVRYTHNIHREHIHQGITVSLVCMHLSKITCVSSTHGTHKKHNSVLLPVYIHVSCAWVLRICTTHIHVLVLNS